MKIYLSGAITSRQDTAHHYFNEAEWRLQHYDVVNPILLDHDHDGSWEAYMRVDLLAMLRCDAIYMLKGWNASPGACLERHIALKLGMEIIYE